MNKELIIAKSALDKVINKSRIHLYKPIHIAEILYFARINVNKIKITELDSYRTISRKWRDEISNRLVGSKSTSSARYQDDVFNQNAVPPPLLQILHNENIRTGGIVESYIYHKLALRLKDLIEAYNYLKSTSVDAFSLKEFINIFEVKSGLKRSIDKVFEIVVYALFSTLVDQLKVTVTLEIKDPNEELIKDFSHFTKYVLGITENEMRIERTARIYRAGVANAADTGLDMWTNFGPAVQVKHLRLDKSLADEITDSVAGDEIVIVCKTAEAELIKSLLNQIGKPIRGIITQDDLNYWFDLCLTKYKNQMGKLIIDHLINEFEQEFPSSQEVFVFLEERGYDKLYDDNWNYNR